jgi:Flp pilus assembly protein TadG
MKVKRIRNTLGNEKGQNLVEFALVVPMLLLLVFGIAEFGRAWMAQNILTGAAREAVRILAVPPGPITPQARADNVLNSAGITTANVSVDDPGVAFGPVSVTIDYDFPVVVVGFIPGLDNTTLPLSSKTTMRREY